MTGKQIQLTSTWAIGERIGERSGFGAVFRATDGTRQAAVKFVPKEEGSSRELLFASVSASPNIVPVWEKGDAGNFHVLVMPLAQESLRAYMNRAGKALSAIDAIPILQDVARGLASLEPTVVHRDLKPDNVLLLGGRWCITDFGISRYAEAATEAETRKHIFTMMYGAPEQWRGERATSRTDVYALGIMAFEMLNGSLPFHGPELRQQHLSETPPALRTGYRALDSIVADCLRKSPGARPTPADLLARLEGALKSLSPAAEGLRLLHGAMAEEEAARDAKLSASRSVAESREELKSDAASQLDDLIHRFMETIQVAAPNASVKRGIEGTTISFGQGRLVFDAVNPSPANSLSSGSYYPPFDVVAFSAIRVLQPPDRFGSQGRSHSLWFCDAMEEGAYKWYELSFMSSGYVTGTLDPFALAPVGDNATIAFIPTMGSMQLSWPPAPIYHSTEDEFVERWLRWFSDVAAGRYQSPSYAPDAPQNRKSGFRPARPNA